MTRPITYTVAHALLPLSSLLEFSCERYTPIDKIHAFILSDGSTGIEERTFAKMLGYTHDRFIRLYRGNGYKKRFLYKLMTEKRSTSFNRGEFSHVHVFVDTPCELLEKNIVVVPSRVCSLIFSLFDEASISGILRKAHRDIAMRCRSLSASLPPSKLIAMIYCHCGSPYAEVDGSELCQQDNRSLSLQMDAVLMALRAVYPHRKAEKYENLCATIISYAYKHVLGKAYTAIKQNKLGDRAMADYLPGEELEKVKIFLSCFAYEMQRDSRYLCNKYEVERAVHEGEIIRGIKPASGRMNYSPIRDDVKSKIEDALKAIEL